MKIGIVRVTPEFIVDLFYLKYNLTIRLDEVIHQINNFKFIGLLNHLIFPAHPDIRITGGEYSDAFKYFVLFLEGNLPVANDGEELRISYTKDRYGVLSYTIQEKNNLNE